MALVIKCEQLRQWANPEINDQALCDLLTQLGFEAELEPVCEELPSKVITGKIISCEKHPDADRLSYCQVDAGLSELLPIVCGCPSVYAGKHVVVATVGAVLPGNFKIKRSKIRGVVSEGMMCSGAELGLQKDAKGIVELPEGTPIGLDWTAFAQQAGHKLVIDVTPNRGDCLSLYGIAREVAAATGCDLNLPMPTSDQAQTESTDKVMLDTPACCYYQLVTLSTEIKPHNLPVQVREMLRLSNIRPIHPIVDLLNYVMIELGQPMHAFDADTLSLPIRVGTPAGASEVELLNDETYTLCENDLVIQDQNRIVGLAGIMGEKSSSVSDTSTCYAIESACFDPTFIARSCRHHDINTDSSFRFERGVDPELPAKAMRRVLDLIHEMDPACKIHSTYIQQQERPTPTISFDPQLPSRLLGLEVSNDKVASILERLAFEVEKMSADAWTVTPPSYRYDCRLPEDLVEEVGRSEGYNAIPLRQLPSFESAAPELWANHQYRQRCRRTLISLGYQELITYSFIDPDWRDTLDLPEGPMIANPLTRHQSMMRPLLLPGLLANAQHNVKRQQRRLKIFEMGRVFAGKRPEEQPYHLGGLWLGMHHLPNWSFADQRAVDFYDVKGDLEKMAQILWPEVTCQFRPCQVEHAYLHPGQSADIFFNGEKAGVIGMLHPSITEKLDLPQQAGYFEVVMPEVRQADAAGMKPKCHEFYPSVKRDMCYVVPADVNCGMMQETIDGLGSPILQDYTVFDVHKPEDQPTELQCKTIAISFSFRHNGRTLVDEEVNSTLEQISESLRSQHNIEVKT